MSRCLRELLAGLLLALLPFGPQLAAAQVGGEAAPAPGRPAPGWWAELPALTEGRATLVDAEVLAGQLELVMTAQGGVLTLRGETGILTLFDGAPDFLWQPRDGSGAREESLSTVVRRQGSEWWLPVDILPYLGLWYQNGVAEGPDNVVLRLVFPPPPPVAGGSGELVDLGAGVPGLRMYSGPRGGRFEQSMLLADAGLLGLAQPAQQARFDELVARSGSDRPLLLFVTALNEGSWESRIEFSQGELQLEVRHPFRLRLLTGQADRVGPRSPVVGVVLLPADFDLRRPIDVRWGDASATVTFRR